MFQDFYRTRLGPRRPFYCSLQNESSKVVMQISGSNSLRMRLANMIFADGIWAEIFADGFLQMDFADGFSPAWILPFSANSFSALTL